MADDLKVTVYKINGSCPVYKNGDKFYLREGYKLSASEELCMHSLASIMPYYNSLSRGIIPEDLGLAGDEGKEGAAFVQCLDPCKITGGGTAVFKIEVNS